MDSRKRKAIMNDGLEYVVHISEDGLTCEVYTDDEDDAMYLGIFNVDRDVVYGVVGSGFDVDKYEVGRLV